MRRALALLLLTGCSVNAMMMPVEGPIVQRNPGLTMTVHVTGVQGNSGNLSFMMPDGEQCKGRWSSAAGSAMGYGSASLLTQYGTTYINGYSLSAGHGQNPGQALATCDKGRTLQLEFVTGAGTSHGYGIGKDSEGNVYRFIF